MASLTRAILRAKLWHLGTRPTAALCLLVLGTATALAQTPMQTPAVGDKAPDFMLRTPTGSPVSLAAELRKGPTVLVVLRGYPGYQCPYCVKQVHDFAEHSAAFAAKQANVLLVYPGPPADLDQRAKEFLAKEANLPANVVLAVDPDYAVTKLYGLRWDAPHETAYPSTFVLDRSGKIVFEQISHTHGDRTTAETALGKLPAS